MMTPELPVEVAMTLVLASSNKKKLAELERVLAATGLAVSIKSLADFPSYDEPVEDGVSFEENALIKARAAVLATGCAAVADDSGLEVDALNKMPGIRSARWAGRPFDDVRNLELVLAQLEDVAPHRRSARFVCAVALVTPDGGEHTWRASMEGHIVDEPLGENGFGYDPIFVADGHRVTTAQLSASDKDAISHRGQAMRAMAAELPEILGKK